jgi:hypothetical protein
MGYLLSDGPSAIESGEIRRCKIHLREIIPQALARESEFELA